MSVTFVFNLYATERSIDTDREVEGEDWFACYFQILDEAQQLRRDLGAPCVTIRQGGKSICFVYEDRAVDVFSVTEEGPE